MPGFAADICGVNMVDYTHLSPGDEEEFALWDGEEIDAPVFNDVLEARQNTLLDTNQDSSQGAQVLAVFKGNYYDGAPALVVNHLGKGKAYYFGAGFSTRTARVFLRNLGLSTPYKHLLELPEEIELSVRMKNNQQYIFVLNYMNYTTIIDVKKPMLDLITQNIISGKIELEKYGVMVLKVI